MMDSGISIIPVSSERGSWQVINFLEWLFGRVGEVVMQNKNISKHMSQIENRPLWFSEPGKIHLKSPWMLWCCAQFNINLPRSIPNPYLHVLHYALCFGRAHSRHSGDFSQLPGILVQDWFRWKIWKQIGKYQHMLTPEIHLLLNWGFFLRASGRESRIWVVDI